VTRRGVVWLAEDALRDDLGGETFLGTFSGHHDAGGIVAEIEGAAPQDAIAWGRQRAGEVWIRLADGSLSYAAGDDHDPSDPPGRPTTCPPRCAGARRVSSGATGDRAIRRSHGRSSSSWRRRMRIRARTGTPVVGRLAARAQATRWWSRQAAGREMPEAVAVLAADPRAGERGGYDATEYCVQLRVQASTALEAMRAGKDRFAAPAGWSVSATARPPAPDTG
jgi:hypothetical protein